MKTLLILIAFLVVCTGCLDDSTDLDLNLNTQDQQDLELLRKENAELKLKLEEALTEQE